MKIAKTILKKFGRIQKYSTKPTKMSASEAFVETMEKHKVNHVWGIVGSAFMDALDLFPTANIRFISVQHEQNAAHAADGYSRVSPTGKHGVCTAQNGPGVTNFVTGIASAFWAHSPVVMISPESGTKSFGLGGFQETEQMALFTKITKEQIHLNNPERMAELTGKAFDSAKLNRGPVQLNIPRDYFYAVGEYGIPNPKKIDTPCAGANTVSDVADVLKDAKNPVIIAGGGVGLSSATDDVVALAEEFNIPIVTSYLHNDVVPSDNKLWCGPLGYQGSKAGMKFVREADVILVLGSRLGPFGTLPQYNYEYWPPAQSTKLIQVDINPNFLGNTVSADYLVHSDVSKFSKALKKKLGNSKGSNLASGKQDRVEKVKMVKAEWEKELDEMTFKESEFKGMRPRRTLRELENIIPSDSVVSTDIGNICSVANTYLRFSRPNSFLAAMTFGSCGYSVPAAMGAKVADPERLVFSYTGDGAFGMSVPEVMTCVREKIPITMVVFNNGQWGAEKKNQVIWFNNRYVGSNLDNNPSYAAIAKSMGGQGIKVEKIEDIKGAMEKAIDNQKKGLPTVVELMVSKELDSPFRRDAMKPPKRLLDKYASTSVYTEEINGQPTDAERIK